jgi:hypothetical protein
MLRPCHGHGMASVNQTRPHCVNEMGKTHSKPLAARHGRGTAWARHGNGMLCVNLPLGTLHLVQILGYWLDEFPFDFGQSQEICNFVHSFQIKSAVQQSSRLMSKGSDSPSFKRMKCEAEHSPPFGTDINNRWNLHSSRTTSRGDS